MLKKLRIALWGAVAIAALLLAVVLWPSPNGTRPEATATPPAKPLADRADWSLTDHNGRPFTAADLNSRPTILVFGFTHCPDVCPTSLTYVTNILETLGPQAAGVRPLFLTVDPERDTTASMAEYVALFDKRFLGLSGAPEEVAKAVADLGVYARKVPRQGGDYTMDHTATILVLEKGGQVRSTLDTHEKQEVGVDKVRLLLNGVGSATNS